jgi:hypothetical protein
VGTERPDLPELLADIDARVEADLAAVREAAAAAKQKIDERVAELRSKTFDVRLESERPPAGENAEARAGGAAAEIQEQEPEDEGTD